MLGKYGKLCDRHVLLWMPEIGLLASFFVFFPVFLLKIYLFIYLFIERGEGREKERRET